MGFSARRCCAGIVVLLALSGSPVLAQQNSARYEFNLPEQALADSLRALGKITHVNIAFDPVVVTGRRSPVLRGQYALGDALNELLSGSGLGARATPGGSFAIEAIQKVKPNSSGSAHQQHDGKVYTFDPVQVHAKVEGFSATRLPALLKDVPQSVSIITQETLREQNANDLAKAFNWATGMTIVKNGSNSDQFYSRGFLVETIHVDNGGPLPGAGQGGQMSRVDLSNYDRVEVLRGADALFGGMGKPGASINLVRKRPLTENAVSVATSTGSWDNYRVEADLSGRLTTDGRLRARLVAANESQRYFYDFARRRLNKLYAITEYDLLPSTKVTLGGAYEHAPDFVQVGAGLPRYESGADARLPRSTAITFPWAESTSTKREGFVQLEHSLSERWKLKAGATRIKQDQDLLTTMLGSAINPVTNLIVAPTMLDTRGRSEQTSVDLTLTGSFDWNGRKQELVLGADQLRTKSPTAIAFLNVSGPPLDPFHFDPMRYSAVASPFALRIDSFLEGNRYGFYAALKLRPAERWAISLGARDNSYRSESTQTTWFGPASLETTKDTQSKNGKITPYFGVVYEVSPNHSLYASYADVFTNAAVTRTMAGGFLETEQGTNKEIGIKSAWGDGRLTGSLALFDIDQRNVATLDPRTPPLAPYNCCYLPGTQRSKGLEAELNGMLTPGWNFGGGYTFNINRTTDGSTLHTQTPKHLLKLWTSYRLPGSASDWTVGGGLTAQSRNYYQTKACTVFNPLGRCIGQSLPYRAEQGPYAIVTLRADYRINGNWNLALNVDNLFDRRYYSTIGGATSGNWYGAPRNWTLTLRGEF